MAEVVLSTSSPAAGQLDYQRTSRALRDGAMPAVERELPRGAGGFGSFSGLISGLPPLAAAPGIEKQALLGLCAETAGRLVECFRRWTEEGRVALSRISFEVTPESSARVAEYDSIAKIVRWGVGETAGAARRALAAINWVPLHEISHEIDHFCGPESLGSMSGIYAAGRRAEILGLAKGMSRRPGSECEDRLAEQLQESLVDGIAFRTGRERGVVNRALTDGARQMTAMLQGFQAAYRENVRREAMDISPENADPRKAALLCREAAVGERMLELARQGGADAGVLKIQQALLHEMRAGLDRLTAEGAGLSAAAVRGAVDEFRAAFDRGLEVDIGTGAAKMTSREVVGHLSRGLLGLAESGAREALSSALTGIMNDRCLEEYLGGRQALADVVYPCISALDRMAREKTAGSAAAAMLEDAVRIIGG